LVNDVARAKHAKFVLVIVLTVRPVCVQHFVTERSPFCDRVRFYFKGVA